MTLAADVLTAWRATHAPPASPAPPTPDTITSRGGWCAPSSGLYDFLTPRPATPREVLERWWRARWWPARIADLEVARTSLERRLDRLEDIDDEDDDR